MFQTDVLQGTVLIIQFVSWNSQMTRTHMMYLKVWQKNVYCSLTQKCYVLEYQEVSFSLHSQIRSGGYACQLVATPL